LYFADHWPDLTTATRKENILRKTPGSQHFLVLAASLAFLLIASTASAAEPAQARPSELEVRVERIVRLQPQADAEVVIPHFKAMFLSDGSVTVRGGGTAVAGAEPQGYDFEVDLASGTYTTRKLDRQEIENRDLLEKGDPEDRQSGDAFVDKAIIPGNYRAGARVQTRDPVFILLAETMTNLVWTVSSSGAVTGTTGSSDRCWAANPSSLGTHWYTQYCKNGALYVSSGRVCNDNAGNYINYDFPPLFPTPESTTASHSVYVCGRNDATYNYDWSANHGGEASYLLTGSVVLGY
jgi:hypothetical protein